MSAETRYFYEFENFRLDPREKVLFRDNQPVSLTPKVFETLQVFVEHAGRLLEKEELMQKIWQDRSVEESNLTFNIKMLRRVLNDDAHQPRFIETVPRRGYRFIAEVNRRLDGVAAQPALSAPAISNIPARRSRMAIAALGAALLALVVFVSFKAVRRPNASVLSAPILSVPFKSESVSSPGTSLAVITPDGKYVAYTIETGRKYSLWLRQLETSENIQIVPPSDGPYRGLAVSQESNSIYFVRQRDSDPAYSAIYRVNTFGGIPVKITESNRGSIGVSPDDRQISFVRCKQQDEDFCSLFVADADGKNEKVLVTQPKPFRILGAQFSPDGRSIAFATGQSRSGGSDFRLLRYNLTNNKQSELASRTFFDIKSLKWLPDGDGLLFTAQEMLDGPSRIWQVATATGEVKALTGDANSYDVISLDKVADKMVATHITNTFHLFVAPAGDLNNAKSLVAARTFTFAPDGKVVYAGVDGDVWTINRDSGEHRQLTNSKFKDSSPRVSPDGRYIFFCSARSGSNHIWRMNADGSNQIQLTKSETGCPTFVTPDQNLVYFESAVARTLWRVSTEGTEEIQFSKEKVAQTAFSADGRFVAYFFRPKESEDHFEIAVMSLNNGKVVKTFALDHANSLPACIAWDTNIERFYFVTWSGTTSVWQQPLDGAEPTFIADFGSEDITDLAVSPDGKFIGFVRGQWIHNAVVIQGLK